VVRRPWPAAMLGGLLGIALVSLTACDSSPPRADRQPQTAPSARTVEPNTPAPHTAKDATAAKPDAPDAAEAKPGTTESEAAEPELPGYLTIIDRYEPNKPARLTAATPGGRRLTLDTRNVRRVRIDREDVPLTGKGSIALTLDGQVFEWMANSQVAVFERSDNGIWRPVPPDEARDIRRARPKP